MRKEKTDSEKVELIIDLDELDDNPKVAVVDYLKYRGIAFDVIAIFTFVFFWCAMFAIPMTIASGLGNVTRSVNLQTEVLIIVGAELKILNANSVKAMQGAGIMPAEKTEVGE